jgi:hypothetical protein
MHTGGRTLQLSYRLSDHHGDCASAYRGVGVVAVFEIDGGVQTRGRLWSESLETQCVRERLHGR